ncbi:MAG: LacI family DNA-binding transcriptional regulator [Bacteroidales bacterium]|nr:LacI family DNA-binding transcriptional regulator [Bacteroidales bacterium]
MKKETLSSISARTGFSITTVSRVLSGNALKYRISPKTAAVVLAEAKRCEYVPSALAQSLRTKKSKMIGLLLPSVSNPFFADMASVIIAELDKFGYMTIVVDTMESEVRMVDNARALIHRNVDGIIAVPCGDSPVALERIEKDVPVVLVDRYYPNTRLSYVTTNNFKGSFDACKLLISKGYKRIVCIQGELWSTPNKERVSGYMSAMRESGLEEEAMVVGNEFSSQNGYLETKLLMSIPSRPEAIFALSNTIALGALKAVREVGMRVPKDVALLSFDDNAYMDYMTPSITRVSQPVDDMAKLSVKILLDSIKNPDRKKSSQLALSATILQGESI